MGKQQIQARIISLQDEAHCMANRMWQGVPSIECTRGGRLYASWYSGGAMEPSMRNYCIIARSDDGGLTWQELFGIEAEPEQCVHAIDVQFWTSPNGRLWLFWVQQDWKHGRLHPDYLNEWAITCDNPDADKPVFSEPFYVFDGFLRNRPIILRDGRWLFPAYNFHPERYA